MTVEHLVIDGGSTDDSAAIVARFPHADWSQGKDKGMSDAINKGFDRAQGDWVMWLNADDRLKPGALAAIKQAAQQTSADIIYGDYDFIAGSIFGGDQFISWYPITPASSLAEAVNYYMPMLRTREDGKLS